MTMSKETATAAAAAQKKKKATTSSPSLHQDWSGLFYQTGFGNDLESECLPGSLPVGRNNPRKVPYNLYTEQLSGTAFTAPRAANRRTWLYRIQPSVACHDAVPIMDSSYFGGCSPDQCQSEVNPLRWKPLSPDDEDKKDFISGMRLMCCAGESKSGLAIYMYGCSVSMKAERKYFYNADGDFLIVPETAGLEIVTELGRMIVRPTEIAVVPRGIVFQVNILPAAGDDTTSTTTMARGYVLEVYKGCFSLPELGPIGSNGLANSRDFFYPVAATDFTDPGSYHQDCTVVSKMHSQLFSKAADHSPLNVVAWHGNYLPFKYDLKRFCAVNSVTYDHLDPSIYTVLTCQTEQTGTALADFVIFPSRVMATDSNTLRPPWFHRNTMSEYMGLIYGKYDAKEGFKPGGASLHNCMTPHGPDGVTYEKAVADACEEPTLFTGGLAFMFETCLPLKVAPAALTDPDWRDMDYSECWQGLSAEHFTGWEQMAESEKDD